MPPPIRVPEEFARFKPIRVIGTGSFGQTLLVEDQVDDHRQVVIKVPHNEETEVSLINDLINNAVLRTSLREMEHPNIVKYLGFAKYEGMFVMILEYVPGKNLRQMIGPSYQKRPPLDIALSLRIVKDICSGLVAAHNARLYHSDIKPDNILVREGDGVAKLCDFGVSRILRSSSAAEFSGTYLYSAPESLAERASFQADLWSLSVTLYEMVTGVVPFTWTGAYASFKEKVDKEDPVPPKNLNPKIDDRLNALILCGLEKSVDKRFRKATDMLAALEACVVPAEVSAPLKLVADAKLDAPIPPYAPTEPATPVPPAAPRTPPETAPPLDRQPPADTVRAIAVYCIPILIAGICLFLFRDVARTPWLPWYIRGLVAIPALGALILLFPGVPNGARISICSLILAFSAGVYEYVTHPAIEYAAVDNQVAARGAFVTVSWKAHRAWRVEVNGSGLRAATSPIYVNPDKDGKISVVARGLYGSAAAAALSVRLVDAQFDAQRLSNSPNVVMLSWNVKDALKVTISVLGEVQPLGLTWVPLMETYELKAEYKEGTVTRTAHVFTGESLKNLSGLAFLFTRASAPATFLIPEFSSSDRLVARGSFVTLVWKTRWNLPVKIEPGFDSVTGNSKSVKVLTTTTFKLRIRYLPDWPGVTSTSVTVGTRPGSTPLRRRSYPWLQ